MCGAKSQSFKINLNGMVQFILMSVRNVDVWVKLQSYKSI